MCDQIAVEKLQKKIVYALEGNIGAGKTTVLKLISEYSDNIYIVEEPVKEWQSIGGKNLLENFYEDPDRWGYSFEFYVLISKMNAILKAAESEKQFIIIERSMFANKIFSDISSELGKLSPMEYTMLMNTYEFLLKNVYPRICGFLYLNTPVNLCVNRIAKRNRSEECCVDRDYLQVLHEKFEKMVTESGLPYYTIDGNFQVENDGQMISQNIQQFMEENAVVE